MKTHNYSQYVAEFIGTFFLVFLGCGAVVLNEVQTAALPGFIIPFVFGGTVTIMIYSLGHISGAHFNPAVTVAFAVARRFPLLRVPGYIFAQVAGALLASLVHLWVWGGDHSFGVTALNTTVGTGIGLEFGSRIFLRVFVFRRTFAGVVISGTPFSVNRFWPAMTEWRVARKGCVVNSL